MGVGVSRIARLRVSGVGGFGLGVGVVVYIDTQRHRKFKVDFRT